MQTREHPASEVYVTGTFDDWKKSEKLEKVGDIFKKDVTLSSADEKIYYKVCETDCFHGIGDVEERQPHDECDSMLDADGNG